MESGLPIGGHRRGGTAIGTIEYRRGPEVASQPVRLATRPVFLAAREGLLADLDDRLDHDWATRPNGACVLVASV